MLRKNCCDPMQAFYGAVQQGFQASSDLPPNVAFWLTVGTGAIVAGIALIVCAM